MRITDKQKVKALEYIMDYYDWTGSRDNTENKQDGAYDAISKAKQYILKYGPNLNRPRELYYEAADMLLNFYQKSEDYELVFSKIYDLLKDLDAHQLEMLSTRIEIMAKEKEADA